MIYTEENFKNASSKDFFEFRCPVCGEVFVRTKSQIKRNKKIPIYCSMKCSKIGSHKGYIIVKCAECGKEKKILVSEYNKKKKKGKKNFFCDSSCAAKYNNRKYHKRERKEEDYICPICGGNKSNSAKSCKNCNNKEKRIIQDFELGHYIGYNEKIQYATHKCQQIRKDAKRVMEEAKEIEKTCAYCHNHEFDEILEVHHIKGILEFSVKTKISEINNINNLVWLCPNHHTMIEKGLIILKK